MQSELSTDGERERDDDEYEKNVCFQMQWI